MFHAAEDAPSWHLLAGLLTLGGVAVVVHFFTGVASPVYALIVGGIVLRGVWTLTHADLTTLRRLLPWSLLLVPLAAYMAPGADAGLYHIPHQRILRDEKIILGLANFHSRYGFSSLLEYIAAPLWIGERFRLLPYVHAAFIAAWLLWLWEWVQDRALPVRVMGILTTFGMLLFCMYLDVGYTSTDVASGLVFAMGFLSGLRLLLVDGPVTRRSLALFFFCTLAAFACKLSAVLLLVWVAVVVALLLHAGRVTLPAVARAAVWPALGAGIWGVKNILTSGCLLYPEVRSCVPVEWAARTNAIENARGITAWARQPRADMRPLESWDWLTQWWLSYHAVFLVGMGVACVAVWWVYCWGFRVARDRRPVVMLPALGCVLLGLALWFFKAPTPRFGTGVFIVLAPVVVVTVMGFADTDRLWVRRAGVWLVVLLALRLGTFTNTDVLRGFYHLRLVPNMLEAPQVAVKPDAQFGFRPAGTEVDTDAICWTAHYCGPDARPPIRQQGGYKRFVPLPAKE